jgi:hypothetical protein
MAHLFLVIVGFVAFWAYLPTLQHVPKHDQIMYLASVAGKEDFSSLAFGAYALNRTVSFAVLDPLVFRPLLYFFLGVEQFFFKYYFPAWQLVGILAHLLVVFALYWLLRTIRPGWPAAFAAGFFALLMVNVPLVNWPNIDPYLVFITLLLFILRECYIFHLDGAEARIRKAAGLMVPAIFIYDAGILFSAPLFMYFLLLLPRRRRHQALWMLFPVSLYFILSVLDLYFVHPYLGSEPSRIAKGLFAWSIPSNFLMALKWLFLGGIFAAPTEMAELGRTVLLPETLGWTWPFTKWSPYLLRGGVFLLMCGGLIAFSATREFFRKRMAFYYLLSTILLSYVLLIVCGRMVSRGILGSLFLNCHYFYLFWVILVGLFYAMVDWEKCFKFEYWRSFRIVAVFVVLLMMAAGAFSVRAVNAMTAREQAKPRALLTHMEGFVKAHRDEPDLSFCVPHSCPGNYPGRWFHKHGDPKWRRYTLIETFYPQYYRPKEEAKYFIACSDFAEKRPVKAGKSE